MCTLVILRRPGHAWPLLLAANRDELRHRPWRLPARHWPERPRVVAGRDELAGGSWLGLNDDGVVAAVLNRRGTLGPTADRRSRGELVLRALDYGDAAGAAGALAGLEAEAYRAFNLVVADAADGFWLRHTGEGGICVQALPRGLAMITAAELDDPSSARIAHNRPLFAAAAPPEPDRDDWRVWEMLLASRQSPSGDPRDAMTVAGAGAYGTVASSLVAVGAGARRFRFAPGRPGEAAFLEIALRLSGAAARRPPDS